MFSTKNVLKNVLKNFRKSKLSRRDNFLVGKKVNGGREWKVFFIIKGTKLWQD